MLSGQKALLHFKEAFPANGDEVAACHSPNPPVILLPRGSLHFPEQGRLAGVDSVGGIKTGRRGVRGDGCWG